MNPSLVIIAGVRTPFARAGTALAELDAVELGRLAVTGLLNRTGIDPSVVDETIFGCVCQPADAPNIARIIALRSGIPKDKPAMTVQRNCASGLQAVTSAQEKLAAGQGEVFIVGGTESMSQMPLLFRHSAAIKFAMMARAKSFGSRVRAGAAFRLHDFIPLMALKMGLTDPIAALNMGETAEILAREFGITRQAQDAFAARSHLFATWSRDALNEEIVPAYVGRTSIKAITEDNGVRTEPAMERLSKLSPVFDLQMGTVTAGNSSQITDGAAALLVCSEAKARQMGWKPLGRLLSHAYTGCDPAHMGLGPVKAIARALEMASWKLRDADVVEINEAFAAQVLAVRQCLAEKESASRSGLSEPLGEIRDERLNSQGGSIALGHPVGATGARLVLTALNQLQRSGKHRALVSLCIGGGQGGAACLESI
jgi:acetyl-CoA acetyltransferase family protein